MNKHNILIAALQENQLDKCRSTPNYRLVNWIENGADVVEKLVTDLQIHQVLNYNPT